MKAQASARQNAPAHSSRPADTLLAAEAPRVLFLQRSGLGPAAFVSDVQSTLAFGGAPLAPQVCADMESRFGRDFSAVRVHDDARAHDSARAARAAAYTVGQDVVFGAGRYAPETAAGRHLLAHELAHTVQQGGLHRRSLDGLALGDDAGLEAEADRAAAAALRGADPAPLSTLGLPRLSRADEAFPETEDGAARAALKKKGIAFVGTISVDKLGKEPAVSVDVKDALPILPKGDGPWVKPLWQQYAASGNLAFRSQLSGDRMPAIKEASGVDYRAVWLGKHGFKNLKELGESLDKWLDSAKAKETAGIESEMELAAKNFSQEKLGGSQVANIDHIVEKQLGGASVPENLQILNAEENQTSGRELNDFIVDQGNQILEALADPGIRFIRLRYSSITYKKSKQKDAYDKIEQLLRDGELAPGAGGGKAEAPKGKPTTLQAGGASALIYVDQKETKIAGEAANDAARRLVSGLDLQAYVRAGGGKKGPAEDQVKADVDAERLKGAVKKAAGKAADDILLDALPGATTPGKQAAVGDIRDLKISGKTKEYDFFFPYLSPGKLTKFGLAPDNSFEAEGYITPTLKFLKRIDVVLKKDAFALKGNLGPENFQPPFKGFKVTETSLSLELAPEFKPSGTFKFQVGPEEKPCVLGDVTAGVEGGGFVLNGGLQGKNIPGVDTATGKVRYHQNEGWSGEVRATTSKLPRTKRSEVFFGFRPAGVATQFYAGGAIQFDVGAGKDLTISADYKNDRMVYAGTLVWDKPIKLVDQVTIAFTYDGETLTGKGSTGITYKSFEGRLTVLYVKKGDEEAKLSGSGSVAVKTAKADGVLQLNVDPNGVISGKGSLSYQISDKLKPTLGVILHPDGHLTILGKIELTQPIVLFPEYPKGGGQRDLIKVNIDIIIPGPFPGLADPMLHLGAGVRFLYGIGPGQIVNTVIEGSFDPLEENKNVKLRFTSTFEVPAHVGLVGILEGGLGIAILGGIAAKAHAGLRIEPGFQLNLVTRAPVVAQYDQGDFSFEGRLQMQGGLVMRLGIKLYAHVEALAGAVEKDFTYDVKDYSYDVGQQMTLTLAKIGYSTKTGFEAPRLDDIKIEPGSIDPILMIRKVAESAKSALAGKG